MRKRARRSYPIIPALAVLTLLGATCNGPSITVTGRYVRSSGPDGSNDQLTITGVLFQATQFNLSFQSCPLGQCGPPEVLPATGYPTNELVIYDDESAEIARFQAYDDDGDHQADRIAKTFPEAGDPYAIADCVNCGAGRDGYYLGASSAGDVALRFKTETTSAFSGNVWLFGPGDIYPSQTYNISNGHHSQLTGTKYAYDATAVNVSAPLDTLTISGNLLDQTGDGIAEMASVNVGGPGGETLLLYRTSRADFDYYRCWDGPGKCQPALAEPSCSFTLGSVNGSATAYDLKMSIPYLDPDGNLSPGSLTYREADSTGDLHGETSALPGSGVRVTASATGTTTGTISVAANDWSGVLDAYAVSVVAKDATGRASDPASCQPPWGLTFETQQLLPALVEGEDDQRLGSALAIDGDTLASGDIGSGDRNGRVYLWTRAGGTWQSAGHIEAPEPGIGHDGAAVFGHSLALSQDTLVVGAVGMDDLGPDSGAAYVLEREGAVWNLIQKLLPPTMGTVRFGYGVEIAGDHLAVSALADDPGGSPAGAVFVFERSGGVWNPIARVSPSDGMPGDEFGSSLAWAGSTLLVGARHHDEPGGAVYVYEESGGGYTETQKLTPPEGMAGLGYALSGDGDRVLIGAPDATIVAESDGAALLYERSGGSFVPVAILRANDPAAIMQFGRAVKLSGDRLIVGANPREAASVDPLDASGGYLFHRTNGEWIQVAKLKNSDDGIGDATSASVVGLMDDGAAIDGGGGSNAKGGIYTFVIP